MKFAAELARLSLAAVFALTIPALLSAQESPDHPEQALLDSYEFRQIGPFRGGRSAAVCGVRGNQMRYYMGAAGGGVWKTDDAGSTWRNISDGFFGGSVGAVEVAPSNPNIIYVGGGEVTVRGNVSHGYGMWKSYDAGKTWTQIGLTDSRRIPRVRVHPHDPDTVWVAALGHLYGPNNERGVYKTTDGGKTWRRVLFVDEEVGACDLVVDPGNPRVLYASMWRILRTPYSLESGGEGCGLYKSTDGGETWQDISRNRGLPGGMLGIIGVTVSPVDSNRVWAQIEAEDGGLFRSDNAGESWTRVNEERKLRQRAWYYTRVYAGTQNIDEVYVLNVGFWRSGDGGRTFSSIGTPHGDHHDLWIDPDDANRMIIADDGGGQVSFDRGENWSTYMNQPTAQFYRVTTDNHFPYRIYGAQQDNSTVRISHRGRRGGIGERDWEPTAGGESGHIAPDPNDPDIVYGGSYGGFLTRINHRTGEIRAINVWPDNPMGHGAGDGKYRFQWNFPIFFSIHDTDVLYTAGNALFKSTDEGGSWQQISPDLTRNDPTKLGPSGGPITKDNTGVEYYCTIFAACESLHEQGVIWCGSDDGLINITRDGGENWEDVTPPSMPEWAQINSIEPHPTEPGGLYVAATRYKLDDFKPYLYRTTDYGQTWTQINDGIDRKHFTRVIRAVPGRPGVLFAGTETGLYISTDDGGSWQPLQNNLPVVPITDLAVKDDDLIVATQGRSFWVLDDMSALYQSANAFESDTHLFDSRPVYRMRGGGGRGSLTSGQNVNGGVPVTFYLGENPEDADIEIVITDPQGNVAKTFSTSPDKDADRSLNVSSMSADEGINQVRWDMRYAGAESFDRMILWGGGVQGPMAVPGTYTVTMTMGDQTLESTFELMKDPRASATDEDLQAQFDFLIAVRDKLTETHSSIKRLRDVRSQINALKRRLDSEEHAELIEAADEVVAKMTAIEERLYQTKNESNQDPLNYPIRLNNRLSALVSVVSTGDNAPTAQSIVVRDELIAEIDTHLAELYDVFNSDLSAFNDAVSKAEIPAIFDSE
ncbi:MAG: glycosyl hydrolase [Planctomycetota bacterium]